MIPSFLTLQASLMDHAKLKVREADYDPLFSNSEDIINGSWHLLLSLERT